MPAIASSDVTYAQQNKQIGESGFAEYNFLISFGDGVLTYPAGGVPLLKGMLGCPSEIRSVVLVSPASDNGFIYKYDLANNKLRIYQGDNNGVADGPLVELGGADAPAAASLAINVKGW